MFIVILVRKHPNSLQISPPSFITFPESFLTHLMCVWYTQVSVQVHAPVCAHVSVRALPLSLSSPLLTSDEVSLPEPKTFCFPRLTGQESVGICLSPSRVTDSHSYAWLFLWGLSQVSVHAEQTFLPPKHLPSPIN